MAKSIVFWHNMSVMSLFWRIILGLIFVVVGFFMVYKTVMFQNITGRIAWAEEKFGGGGTNTFLKLLGVLVIFLGVFFMTGIINDIAVFFFDLLTPGS